MVDKQRGPQISLNCSECNVSFDKNKREYDRQVRVGRLIFFCGLACAATFSNRTNPRRGDIANFKGLQFSCDALSPFRYYARKARMRYPPADQAIKITETYIKQLWEEQHGRCALTGLKLNFRQKDGMSNDYRTAASLDRIDSALPYQIGNVQFVSVCVNFMKSDMSNEAAIEFIEAIKSGKDLC